MTPNRPSRLRLAIRAHGPINGPLVWAARILQGRFGYRASWPLWRLSNHYEQWRFRRMYDRIVRRRGV